MRRLGILGAAMFAEPTVTEVEEVVRLVHGKTEDRIQKTEFSSQKSKVRVRESLRPGPTNFCLLNSVSCLLLFYLRRIPRFGVAALKRTGTDALRPFRMICTWTVSPT